MFKFGRRRALQLGAGYGSRVVDFCLGHCHCAFYRKQLPGQSQYDLVKLVTERRQSMFEMQFAFWPLFNINNDKSTDLAAAVDTIKKIDENFDRFLELLREGTAGGQVPGSRAKPQIWAEPSEFSAAVERLRSATARLSKVASTGDIDAFKLEFATFQPACFGCHDFKGSGGGQFRFPRDAATTGK